MTSAHTAVIPLSMRLRGQLSGSGGRGRPAVVESHGKRVGFTPRSRVRLQIRFRRTHWVPRLHPRVGVVLAYWMELGAIGEKARRAGRLGRPVGDASGCLRQRHVLANPAFRLPPKGK